MEKRKLDVKTAKKALKNTCDFLEIDDSEIADFKIPSREAFLMWIYTGTRLGINKKCFIKFNQFYLSGREPFWLSCCRIRFKRRL